MAGYAAPAGTSITEVKTNPKAKFFSLLKAFKRELMIHDLSCVKFQLKIPLPILELSYL